MPTDPYRMGYEFTGWYRDKSCSADSLFDPEQNITGKNGDVLTLYAGWKLFADSGQDSSPQETIRYETEYYEEWEPTQQELLEFGESSQWKPPARSTAISRTRIRMRPMPPALPRG